MAGTVGTFQANEAIKLITGIGESLVGQLVIYDALEAQVRKVRIRKDPNCAVCGANPTVTELIDYEAFCGTISQEAADAARESTISVRDLEQMLEARDRGETDFVLIDVREPAEREIVAIDGSELIPKNEFLLGDALQSLPQDKPAVFYCKVGSRSAEVLAVVKGAGFANAKHVGGGVVAWVNQIEPAKPVY
jgi:adenylyltransferase/sulfurtransferase